MAISELPFARLAAPPVVPWKTGSDGDRYVHVPEVCGPLAWDMLHRWAGAVHDSMCPTCGDFAIKAARAVHDTVNVKLGRPVQYPDDLAEVLETMQLAAAEAPAAEAAQIPEYSENTGGDPLVLKEDGPGLTGIVPREFQGFKVRTRLIRSRGKKTSLKIRSPFDLQPLFRNMRGAPQEWLIAVFGSGSNEVIGVEETNLGTKKSVDVSSDAIFRTAILLNASTIFLAHNHPSGDPTPSPEDEKIFERLRSQCTKVLDIKVQDLLVIGADRDYSIQGRSYLDLTLPLLSQDGLIAATLRQVPTPWIGDAFPDPWGSRCRDKRGRWIMKDECGAPPEGEKVSDLTFAVGSNGLTRYEMRHKVVELGSLIVSHDPFTFEPNEAYPADLQPRLRERKATQLQVQKIAETLDAGAMLTDFRVLDRGSPIVGDDDIVESGNGRVMALLIASGGGGDPDTWSPAYESYVDELGAREGEFGVAGQSAGRRAPVLVRVRLTEVDRRTFTQEANTPATFSPSAIEQARTDAEGVTVGMLDALIVGETQSIEDALRSSTNRGFVQTFLSKIPDQEQARLVDAQGVLNQDGVRRTMLAVFVSAFPGDAGLKLAELSFESIDLQVRNVVNALGRGLGQLAKAEALVREGLRPAGLAIGDDLASAVNVFARIKRTPGHSVQDYLSQLQLMDRELTPFQEDVLRAIDERSRSARRMSLVFRSYAELVIETPPPSQGAFFPEAHATQEELWELAVSRSEDEMVAAQKDVRLQVDWCNMSPAEIDDTWSWRPLREVMAFAMGLEAPVWACSAGMLTGQIQVTIDTQALSTSDENRVRREIERRLGPAAKRVIDFGVRRLIYEVNLPSQDVSPEELIGRPQEVIAGPPRREGSQPTLFRPTPEQLLGDQLLDDVEALIEDVVSKGIAS